MSKYYSITNLTLIKIFYSNRNQIIFTLPITKMTNIFTCKFTLPHEKSQELKETLETDENKDCVSYSVENKTLIVEIKSDSFRSLVKTSNFFIERYKLCLETFKLCEDDF